jgi:diaminohydroxyphosphoribosylaminopyrimidine deaminase/5-amino-6-(5-phosphoribosylamino)uracil reductase
LEDQDVAYMKLALKQARKGLGRTSPNPAVGAVVVKDGRVIAAGHHRKAGSPHAEVDALAKLDGYAQGATLYVTLEPCNHHGRTPPCTEAILKSGIRRVVVGMKDPNPGVRGGGIAFLSQMGVAMRVGVLEKECERMNEAFIRFVTSNRPFIILKSALTLDGWTATRSNHSAWITNERSRGFVHRMRDRVDAIVVGVGTVLCDNPSLTTRLKGRKGRNPIRIVVDTHLRTPFAARVVRPDLSAPTVLVAGERADPRQAAIFEERGIQVIRCQEVSGRIDLVALMGILGKMSIMSVLVEGGASLVGSLLRERLVDKLYLFTAPKILGGDDGIPLARGRGPERMDECLRLTDIERKRFGDDTLIVGYPSYHGENDPSRAGSEGEPD